MANDLLKYFEKRVAQSSSSKNGNLPFITVSRQTGCNANELAVQIIKSLGVKNLSWQYINKEVLQESARKLKMKESEIKYVFDTKERTHMDDILSALSHRYYKSDRIVRKTITEVLRHYAKDGNIIIVGRAGVATTQGLKGGLHIRLTAPYEWRIKALKRRKAFTETDIAAFIKKHDRKKRKLIEGFYGKKMDDIQFDLSFNCAFLSKAQIAQLVVESMHLKKMI